MVTIEQFFIAKLEELGIFQQDAISIINMAKDHELFINTTDIWDKPITCDPNDPFLAAPGVRTTWISLRQVAIEWVDANKPNAWFRANLLSS